MSDFKSKMPDMKDLTAMATKFFLDMKNSVCEIMEDYKQKRSAMGENEEDTVVKKTKTRTKANKDDSEL